MPNFSTHCAQFLASAEIRVLAPGLGTAGLETYHQLVQLVAMLLASGLISAQSRTMEGAPSMLRITVKETEATWRMKLEGKLAAEWVDEVEKTWSSANVAGKVGEVDLTELTLVDDAGGNLLQNMSRGGASFVASGIALRTRLEEITNKKCLFRKLPLLAAALTLVIAAAPACLRAQGQSAPMPLKLHQAVQIALQQNPEVAVANLNYAKSQEKRSEARAALLPQVSLGASEHVVRENTATLFGRSVAGFPGHVGPFWTVDGGMTVSAPAFDMSLIN